MPRDSRVKRVRTIAAILSLADVERTHEDLPTTEPLPTQPPTTQHSPTQPPTPEPLLTQPQPSQLPPSPHTVGSSVASAPSSSQPSRVRGVMRGKNATKLRRHDALVQRIEEQSQSSVTTPVNEEEIAVDVLGKRCGYLNGYGIYTRSSSSTQSWVSHSEVIALREQVAKQAKRQAEWDRRQAERDKRIRALEAIVQQLASAAGIDLTNLFDITRGTTSAGDGTAIGDHDATFGGGGAHLGP